MVSLAKPPHCPHRNYQDDHVLVCACQVVGPHVHEAADGTRFIGALTAAGLTTLVFRPMSPPGRGAA